MGTLGSVLLVLGVVVLLIGLVVWFSKSKTNKSTGGRSDGSHNAPHTI